jgi:hypothetical protein
MYGAARYDDGLSQLAAEEYLQVRVGDQVSYYHRRIRYLYRLRTALELLAGDEVSAAKLSNIYGGDIERVDTINGRRRSVPVSQTRAG